MKKIASIKIEESILFSNNSLSTTNNSRSLCNCPFIAKQRRSTRRIGSGPESGSRRMGNMLTAA